MKCKRCKEVALVALPSHNTGFCRDCFLEFFRRQVERGIEKFNMISKDKPVLVALSGGKDSLSLMLELMRQGYDVTGLHIDLGIGKSSHATRQVVERFCAGHNLRLIIKDMESEGLPIPLVKKHLRRPICSACGKIKRYFFNKTALDNGFSVLATGHNLDDEVARLFSNVLRWDVPYLSDQGPYLESAAGFAPRAKPLWRLTEFEVANYAFMMDIEYHYAPCPYSSQATFSVHKNLWFDLEEQMPGRKIEFYQGFIERARSAFANADKKNGTALLPCRCCGYPTSDKICGVCRIRQIVTEKSDPL
jgi:uncharacterized protein (TIGR00269 family)